MSTDWAPTVLQPLGLMRSSCGYCSEPGARSALKSSVTTGAWPLQLSCEAYMDLIDRGWRRSGEYLYKPDLRQSCCPQYTMRLEADRFRASKKHRQLINKFNRFVLGGPTGQPQGHGSKGTVDFDLVTEIHAAESPPSLESSKTFLVNVEPASFTMEKFYLYESYQKAIHSDDDTTTEGFKRFLVDTPFPRVDSVSHETIPRAYGSYHQMYRVDGKLVAMGVLDILPRCVSSVYFMYSPDWSWASFGKLSALREIALVNELRRSRPEIKYLYMGFYIHSCEKMKYKAGYRPSFLLDPESYEWYDFDTCSPLLDQHPYVSFATHDKSIEGPTIAPSNGQRETSDLVSAARIMTFDPDESLPTYVEYEKHPSYGDRASRDTVERVIDGIGPKVMSTSVFYL